MKNRRKVLFFTPPSVGGSERMTITIAKMLPTDEFEVKFVIVGKQGSDIEKFIPDKYVVIHLHLRSIWDFTVFRMAHIMRSEHPSVVFCSLRYMAVHMVAAAKLVGGIESIVRSDNDMRRAKKINLLLMRITFPWCKWIIAQQDEMRKELLDYLPLKDDHVITLQNPLDKETITKKLNNATSPYPNDGSVNYVWVARFKETKGQDVLVRAFNIVYKQQPNAHLYLVGAYDENSAYFKDIQLIISEGSTGGHVHFVGYDANPYRWMKYCNCFVLPSRYEGLPNALIEAMYLGAPVVATRCIPVIDRIVEDGKTGYIVDSEDVVSMAKRMIDAVSMCKVPFVYHSAKPEDFIQLFR